MVKPRLNHLTRAGVFALISSLGAVPVMAASSTTQNKAQQNQGRTKDAQNNSLIESEADQADPDKTGGQDAKARADGNQDITVIGTRLGAGDAADVKRRALQSVSVLTAEEIEKLPDTSLGSVLRKVPGVQVSTRTGGATIRIRGLGQTEDRVNGRNLTSTVGRGYDVAALPADFVSGVDVYKTPSASLIEGGIGGQIDFHTRRPFDYNGLAATFSTEGVYSSITKAAQPLTSGYVSDRWDTGIGEIGLLVGGAYQRNVLGQRVISVDGYSPITSGGFAIDAPIDVTKESFRGVQTLANAYASAQWKPVSSLTFTGDFIYNRSTLAFTDNTLTTYLTGVEPSRLATYGNGSSTAQTGSWGAVQAYSSTSQNNAYFETFSGALNGQYVHDRLTVSAEAAYTHTGYRSVAPSFDITATAPRIDVDLRGSHPNFAFVGLNQISPAQWSYDGFSDFQEHDNSTEWAYRGDAIYAFDGLLKAIKVGARFDRRTVGSIYGAGPDAGFPAPDDITAPAAPFVGLSENGYDGPQSRWISPSGFQLEHYLNSVRALFGAPLTPPALDPKTSYFVAEKIYNGYAEATFSIPIAGIVFDGNVGVRYARTDLSVDGYTTAQTGSGSINAKQSYENWLPQVNVRAKLMSELFLRLAYSKQVTRPSFGYFNPGLSLDINNRTGSAGNPMLKPLQATQYDVSLEYYPTKGGSIYAAAFYKDVAGYIASQRRPETIRGVVYQITRPYNLTTGWIGGAEAGIDQRFTFLPNALAGLGLNASYTYVGSSEPANSLGVRAPLAGLAHHNYQVTGSYDRNGVYVGLTWVWSSRIVLSALADSAGRPLYLAPYGQLDASASYAVTKRISLTASALNLLGRRDIQYYQDAALLNRSGIEDKRILVGARIQLGSAR